MTCNARRVRDGWIATPLAVALLALLVGCAAGDPVPEAVREAAEEHVRASGGKMSFDDPSGDGRLTLAFDHVHDGVEATEGGRQVVCVDFKGADGTLYDVDFYIGGSEGSDALLVEDTMIHKVNGRNVLSTARRAELDRKN